MLEADKISNKIILSSDKDFDLLFQPAVEINSF